MHILYLHQYFVPPDGSGGTRSYEMARRMVAAGHSVSFITSSAFFPSTYFFGPGVTQIAIDGIRIRVINVSYSNKLTYSQRILAFIKFAVLAVNEVRKIKNCDVVFATSTPLTIALPGVIAKKSSRCLLVFEVRDLWPELPVAVGALTNPILRFLAKSFESWAYRNSDHIVALSPGMKDGVVRCGVSADKVSVIPNSCDVELFHVPEEQGRNFIQQYPHLDGGKLVTYTGTFGIINGVEYLVEIAAEMLTLDPEVRFLITGDGMKKKDIINRARSLGVLDKNLWVIPPIPKSQVPDLLSASTVACSLFINLPEMWHNSANKFFDALAAGRPLMINYGGWQMDILESTGAGLVVPPDRQHDAARLLCEFINDTERLSLARKQARVLADDDFSRDNLFGKLHRVLIDAAQKGG